MVLFGHFLNRRLHHHPLFLFLFRLFFRHTHNTHSSSLCSPSSPLSFSLSFFCHTQHTHTYQQEAVAGGTAVDRTTKDAIEAGKDLVKGCWSCIYTETQVVEIVDGGANVLQTNEVSARIVRRRTQAHPFRSSHKHLSHSSTQVCRLLTSSLPHTPSLQAADVFFRACPSTICLSTLISIHPH